MKLRLTEDFAGSKKGTIFEVPEPPFGKSFGAIQAEYKMAQITIPYASTLFEEVKPLFTTYDGVEVFEGNVVYNITGNSRKLKDSTNWKVSESKLSVGAGQLHEGSYFVIGNGTDKHQCSYKDNGGDPVWLTFSTRKKAEEYRLMNQPVMSLKAFLDEMTGLTELETKEVTEFFKKKIKENEGVTN